MMAVALDAMDFVFTCVTISDKRRERCLKDEGPSVLHSLCGLLV